MMRFVGYRILSRHYSGIVNILAIFLLFYFTSHCFADTLYNKPDNITEPKSENSETQDTVHLDEISIVAIKSGNNAMMLPIATTEITNAEVEQLNIKSVKNLADLVPNFYMADYGSKITSSIYVRGLGSRIDQPAVGLIVDNVAIMNKDAYDFDVEEIYSAEVYRGPQSTLYGRNTMAGLVNITSLSPAGFNGWKAFASVGNYNTYRLSAGRYASLSNRSAISLNIGFDSFGGYYDNVTTNEKVGSQRNISLRSKFASQTASGWSFNNVLSLSTSVQSGYPYQSVEKNVICYNDTCSYQRMFVLDGFTASRSYNNFSLSLTASLQHLNDKLQLDQDFLAVDYFNLLQRKKETDLTFEAIIKKLNHPDTKYHFITGLFSFYKHLQMSAPVTFKNDGIANLIENNRNNVNPEYPIKWLERKFTLNSDFTLPGFGIALYHESYFKFNNWKFTAGLRADYERIDLSYHSYTATGYNVYHLTPAGEEFYRYADVNINDTGKMHKSFFNLMPKFALSYSFDKENGMIYATVARGYKSGGFNTQMFSDVLQQRLMMFMGLGSNYQIQDVVGYKPEYSINYEIGVHASMLNKKLNVDADIFLINCTNQQMTVFPDGLTTGRIMTNAGKTLSYGAEIALKAYPVKQLSLNLSYGFTNARFREYNDGKNDYAGLVIPYVPAHTLFGQIVYTLPVNNKMIHYLMFDANVRGVGDIYWNEANTIKQPFYALLGASVTINFSNFDVELWGNNLTNSKYDTFYFKSINNEFLQRGRPVSFGVTFRLTI